MSNIVLLEKVAFVAHPLDAGVLRSYFALLRPDKTYDDQLQLKLFEWSGTYSVKEFPGLSLDGCRSVDGELLMVPFLPEMQSISVRKVIDKVDHALALARAHGCTIAAMGGFTSIVLQNREAEYSRKHDVRITSGNSLTAAIIIRSVEEIVSRFNIDLASSVMAVIGASGDIGSACVDYFCGKVRGMWLTARSIPTLATMVQRCRDGASAEIRLTDSNAEAVGKSGICIFVTSAYVSLFTENDFNPGTVVCDASAPQNVRIAGGIRDDVFIYHGGIASIPFPIDVGFDIGLASPRTFYGCQLEGLLLGLHPEVPCSWGRGNITRDRVVLFLELLDRYPSIRPVFTLGNIEFTEEQISAYARRWRSHFNNIGSCGH